MNDTVIKVENISKLYALGEIGTGTLSRDFHRWWYKVRGKEDPFLKIGETNDRAVKGNSDYVWALKDINFEVKRGEILGIIGRNGAGKSTLLKILSRVTTPTSGEIKIKGRIASLLEVGTGFNSELTGRENIYLNGAILGMRKSEIDRKFDEIVEFAEVERYIDTPVKRYSSGMYVRLAFAVAAHLDPEILIVDEVLAVGDAEFQRKCLGKMQDASTKGGRTVLFVSHNLTTVRNLCTQSVCLSNGGITAIGTTEEVITHYLETVSPANNSAKTIWHSIEDAPGDGTVALHSVGVKSDGEYRFDVDIDKPIEIEFEFWNKKHGQKLSYAIHLLDAAGSCLFSGVNWTSACSNPDPWYGKEYPIGLFKARMIIPSLLLNDGLHMVRLFVLRDMNTEKVPLKMEDALTFNVIDTGVMRKEYQGSWIGAIRPRLDWQTTLSEVEL